MQLRKKIETVKAIPRQIETTLILSLTGLVVAVIALFMVAGVYRAN